MDRLLPSARTARSPHGALIIAAVCLLALPWPGAAAQAAVPGLTGPVNLSAPAGLSRTAGINLDRLPLYFVENRGLYPAEVTHFLRGADKTLFFTPGGVTFALGAGERRWAAKLDFVGAARRAPVGREPKAALFSRFSGPERRWATAMPSHGGLVYRDLWPGIDLVYSGAVNRLKYEFRVRPGADPQAIRLRWRGATRVAVTAARTLRVETPAAAFEDAAPTAWQLVDGERVAIAMDYEIEAIESGDHGDTHTTFGFRVGDHDPTLPLVLDPALLVYCGYLGSHGVDYGRGIAVDGAGATYIVGSTGAGGFPVTVGPDLSVNGGWDAFVAKVDPTGTKLIYCGYIGGASEDRGYAVAVDTAGCAYVAGGTRSTETTFPVKLGPGLKHNGTMRWDGFVARVNPAGTSLDYCGYVGGANDDFAEAIDVDASGAAYITGHTDSDQTSFPVSGGPSLTFGGALDAYVAKIDPTGKQLVYCGYIGGTSDDWGLGLAVDAAGQAHITGVTHSTETSFPVRVGPSLVHRGHFDAYVAKVNAGGTALVYCGYIGGTLDDNAYGIDLDAGGNAYVGGATFSDHLSFPVTVGPDLTFNAGGNGADAFVAKVDVSGKTLAYCGYVGGAGIDCVKGIGVDASGHAYVAGYSYSTETSFPVQAGPGLSFNGGAADAFVAAVQPAGTALAYCGYIGGTSLDLGHAIAVSPSGTVFVTGDTHSSEASFPVAVFPYRTYLGNVDAFVAKVVFNRLTGSGLPQPGGAVKLHLKASDSARLLYQFGSSFGTGPIPIDSRKLGLSADALLEASVKGWAPGVFVGYSGRVNSAGEAWAEIRIPKPATLIGIAIHTAAVTLDATAPSGVRAITNTYSFQVVAK